jgi:hypothetical protein
MKLFDIFNVFKKKKDLISESEPLRRSPGLPEDLERFRVRRYPETPPEQQIPEPQFQTPEQQFRAPEPQIMEPEVKIVSGEFDKIDFVIQKLETIDARLKLIEERTMK